jgi:Ohr subfamily peroxiredoxin
MAMSLKKVLYTGKAHTTGGRNGASRSSDGRLDIKLSSPGTPGNGTNPEQLFAAGWSACFMGAMGLAAAKMRTRLPADAAVDAEVDLCDNGGEYFLKARLNVSLPGIGKSPRPGRCRTPDVSLFQGHTGERRRRYQRGVSQNAPPHSDLRRGPACRRGRRLPRPKTTHDNDQREGGSSCPICTLIYPAPIPSR